MDIFTQTEILLRDDDMAGRTGHLPLARAFQRHHMRLRHVEQDRTRFRDDFGASLAIGMDEGDAHQFPPCKRTASLMAFSPSRNACSDV